MGLEGLIGKRANSRYETGKRSVAWIKLKLHLEQEFVIGGYTEPEGGRKYFGALLVDSTKGLEVTARYFQCFYNEVSRIRKALKCGDWTRQDSLRIEPRCRVASALKKNACSGQP
jgi:ATP-dependent DNA ligase